MDLKEEEFRESKRQRQEEREDAIRRENTANSRQDALMQMMLALIPKPNL